MLNSIDTDFVDPFKIRSHGNAEHISQYPGYNVYTVPLLHTHIYNNK